jgi:hypothetical protein
VKWILLTIVTVSLAGCNGTAPRAFSGTFSANSAGKATQFIDLANQPGTTQHAPTEVEISVNLEFVSKVDPDGTIEIELKNIIARSATTPLFEAKAPWNLRTKLNQKGGIGSIDSDTELNITQLWVVRCFLSYWRDKVPQDGTKDEVEFDGRNTVVYSPGTAGLVSRTWKTLEDSYADLPDMPNRESIPIRSEVSGSISYTLDSNGTVLTAKGEKKSTSRIASRVAGSSSLSVDFQQKPITPVDRTLTYGFTYPFTKASKADENEKGIQEKNLDGATLDQLWVKAAKKNPTTKERNAVFLQLRALFYLQKEASEAAVTAILKPGVSETIKGLVLEALTGSGTTESQVAFARVLEAERETEGFHDRLTMLMPITNMEPTCQAILMRSAFDPSVNIDDRYAAQLVVGGNIRRCLNKNKAQAEAFSTRLSDALKSAPDDDMRLNLLYALGNAADPSRLPLQLQFLKDQSPVLRAAAVHSLRHLLSDQIRADLATMRKAETNKNVIKEIESLLSQ